ADDLVVAHDGVFRVDGDPSAALRHLELQDLTGLVGASSGRRVLPPEEAVRDAAPFRILSEERRERFRVATVERIGCGAKLVDHHPKCATGGGNLRRTDLRIHLIRWLRE